MSIVRPRSVMRDTVASGSWMVVRMLALGAWLFLVARLLSADVFGWLAGVLGVCAVCTLVTPGGIPYLFFADAHRSDARLSLRWREALGCIALLGPVLSLLALALLQVWARNPVSALLAVSLVAVEILCGSLVQTAALLAHARGNLTAAAGLPASLMVGRATGGGLLVSLGWHGLAEYLIAHIVATLVVAFVALMLATQLVPLVGSPQRPSGATLREAWGYAFMGAGTLAGGELDKPLVGRIAGLAAAGYYAPAYRICAAMATPATALAASLLPRWSKQVGDGRIDDLLQSFRRAGVWVVSLGLLAAIVLRWVLDQVPLQHVGLYRDTWPLIRDMAWLAAALGLHQLAGTAMIAVGRPVVRAVIDTVGLALLAVLMVTGYRYWGMAGIVAGCLIAEIFTATLMVMAVVYGAGALRRDGETK